MACPLGTHFGSHWPKPEGLLISTVYCHLYLITITSMLTHQVAVAVVAVFLGHGQVHSQGHTVCKDGQ